MQGVAWENEGGRGSADPRTLVYLVKSGSCLTSRDPKLEANCRFSGGSEDKASACNAGDAGSIPRLGRCPGEGNGNPLQYSCRENPMDSGAWWLQFIGLQRARQD